ncbi:MAG: tetratricopeptide repeat protein, partial [Leeuwenhoekiella sp.]
MKTKFLLTLTLSFSAVIFAQKKELRTVEKSIKSGSFAEAKTELTSLEGMMGAMDEDQKEQYYFLKGQAYLGAEDNKDAKSIETALEAFTEVSAHNDGKKYGDEAAQFKAQAMNAMISSAVDDQNAEKYDSAASKLYNLYKMSPKDTVYLYYAASNAVNGQDYDTALDYYNQLKDLGYRGVETKYTATNKESGETEEYATADQRDLFVKAGTHVKPETVKTPPKSAEIAKNIALIYISQDKNDEALAAMADARAENPDDDTLLRSEADIYLKMGMNDKYEEAMQKIIAKDPNNAELYYNLGVGAAQSDNTEKAKEYYTKALEIDPNFASANLNMAAAILEKDKEYIDEMNGLGNSNADNKRYDALKSQRMDLYRNSIPYLEKAVEANPKNIEA